MWGSDGRSAGYVEGVDVVVEEETYQAKKRKVFPKWMIVPEKVDYQVVQTDRKPPMLIMPIEKYFELLSYINFLEGKNDKI